MRLRPEKIDKLARLVAEALKGNPEVTLAKGVEDVAFEVRKAIEDDLRAEEEIDAEARRILDEHAAEMQRLGANYQQTLQKTKHKLARDRGMVL